MMVFVQNVEIHICSLSILTIAHYCGIIYLYPRGTETEVNNMFAAGIITAIIAILIIIIGVVIIASGEDGGAPCIIIGVIVLILGIVMIIIGSTSNSFKRELKDIQSDYGNGIHRIITAEDGRTIYTYEGTVDLEINGEERKIKFEDENGNRQIVIYGIQDTVTIIEN